MKNGLLFGRKSFRSWRQLGFMENNAKRMSWKSRWRTFWTLPSVLMRCSSKHCIRRSMRISRWPLRLFFFHICRMHSGSCIIFYVRDRHFKAGRNKLFQRYLPSCRKHKNMEGGVFYIRWREMCMRLWGTILRRCITIWRPMTLHVRKAFCPVWSMRPCILQTAIPLCMQKVSCWCITNAVSIFAAAAKTSRCRPMCGIISDPHISSGVISKRRCHCF